MSVLDQQLIDAFDRVHEHLDQQYGIILALEADPCLRQPKPALLHAVGNKLWEVMGDLRALRHQLQNERWTGKDHIP